MKKLNLIIFLTALNIQLVAQPNLTDIKIANSLIAKDRANLIETLDTLNIEYWITARSESSMEIYIQYNNSVRLWQISFGDIIRIIGNREITVASNVSKEIFVRYRHSNLNDLKHYFSYDLPENTESKVYEKENGDKLSHLRIRLK